MVQLLDVDQHVNHPSDEAMEMIATIEPVNAAFALSDPADPRHQYITALRRRFGTFLHAASISLRQQGEENTVDAVHMLVRLHLPLYITLYCLICCLDTFNPDIHAGVRRQQRQVRQTKVIALECKIDNLFPVVSTCNWTGTTVN